MTKLRTVSRYFINAVLAAVLLSSCSDWNCETHDGVYSYENTLVVQSKKQQKDSSYWYVVKDEGRLDKGFDLYTKVSYNIGDTLEFRTLHSR